jgi:hypothetical protein
MFLNIITPCIRPENLFKIAESINIPKNNYRWIVIFDSHSVPDVPKPNNAEYYAVKNFNSISGNAQRNLGLDKVSYGYVYFNDDDTTLHPDLWDNISNLTNDFISFKQNDYKGNLRLEGKDIKVTFIDSHNFVVSYDVCKDIKWVLDRYEADGIFAEQCYNKSKFPIYIPKVLSIYNILKLIK